PKNQEAVMPVKGESIASHRVKIVTVPGDGHCLLYSFLFFKWLKANPGKGIPKNFALQAKQVSFMRKAFVIQLKKLIEAELKRDELGQKTVEDFESRNFALEWIPRLFDRFNDTIIKRLGPDEEGNFLDYEYYAYPHLTGLEMKRPDALNLLSTALLLRGYLRTEKGIETLRTRTQKQNDDDGVPKETADALMRDPLNLSLVLRFLGQLKVRRILGIAINLKSTVTMAQLCEEYLEIYREHINCAVPVFEGEDLPEHLKDVPKPIDSKYHLADLEAELLARMVKTKIYVYYKNPAAGTYTHQKTYGSSLFPNSPIISLVNINSDHWAPLVGKVSTEAGAGASAFCGAGAASGSV
ncbi:MAG: hypothetical protein WCJ17_01175, partial [bacterium]